MRNFLFLLLSWSFCHASLLHELDTQTQHLLQPIPHLDSAFVIRLDEKKDLSSKIGHFKEKKIALTEFQNYRNLSLELMTKYCSAIMSPYLLTRTLSHLSIYKYCLQNRLKTALVVEDHAQFVGNPADLARVLKRLNKTRMKWDILYLDVDYHDPVTGNLIVPQLAHIPRNRKTISNDLSRIFCRYGSTAFVISQSGMRKLLHHFNHHWHDLPFDQVLFQIPNLNIIGTNFDIVTNEYKLGKRPQRPKPKPKAAHKPHILGQEEWVDPKKLLTYDRIDIIPKYIYAKYCLNQFKTNWHIDLYHSHVDKWSNCYNAKPLKIGFADFKNAFDKVISSISKNGFNEKYAIEMNENWIPWNGAHRIGTCLALKVPIKIKAIEKRPSQNITTSVFRNSYGLEEKYLDHIAFEYAKLNKNTFVVSVYPLGRDHYDEIEQILKKNGQIIHSKDVRLSQSGALEFIRLVYTGEWWTGCHLDNYKHSRGKVLVTLPEELRKKYPVRIYLFECDNLELATETKRQVRERLGKGDHVIHVNDTHEQTVHIASTLFNQNSLDFINHRKLNHFPNFEKLLKDIPRREDICIGHSGVLSAYGEKESESLKLITPSTHPQIADDILYNPENHFYYNGVKFLRLDLAEKMKSDIEL
ncbi:MAG: glycosyltransferase family 25 protein [Simkaniaceae bacterium]|nr:glycosyltransferase family 25 protein [Simkaniaceae bacterium]